MYEILIGILISIFANLVYDLSKKILLKKKNKKERDLQEKNL